MSKIYFIQFYKTDRILFGDGLLLQNGFSKTWKLCDQIGEFVWVSGDEEIPRFDSGAIYISAYTSADVIKIHKYAKENPQVNITLGGPSTLKRIKNQYKLPNLKITSKLVEELLFPNVELTTDHWDLVLPKEIENSMIFYGYTLEDRPYCYWGKCSFCGYSKMPWGRSASDCSNFNPPDIKFDGMQSIWLASTAINARQLENLYKNIVYDENKIYRTYMRADKAIVDNLERILKTHGKKNFTFVIGVEFPSDKVLNYFNKGVTQENIIKLIKTIHDYGENCILCLITDVPGADESDLEAVKLFHENIKDYSSCISAKSIQPLFFMDDMEISNDFKGIRLGIKLAYEGDGYFPLLLNEERRINDEITKIFHAI